MPPVWGWILAYLLGFLLFQAFIYWYLQGDGASLEGPSSAPVERDLGVGSVDEAGDRASPGADSSESIQCRHCGAYNEREPTYTYCRECLGQLR